MESYQIDFIEVGIPFSDPLADGPIIQNTSQVALQNGMNLDLIFKQLAKRATKTPLVLMGYINPIISFGLESFFKICKRVNISAVIIPDMSLEIYDRFYSIYFEKHSVKSIKSLKDLNVKLIDTLNYIYTNSDFEEIIKTGYAIIRPDLHIFGVSDTENSIQDLTDQFFEMLCLRKNNLN